jgi:AraC-like DNA-binding protein
MSMDIIGDAIRALRIGEPRSARAHLYGRWGLRFDPSSGAGFHVHVVLQGAPWLIPPGGGDAIALHAGDVVFISRSLAHGLADSPQTPLVDVPQDPADYWFGRHADPALPADTPVTVVLGGSYYLDRMRVHPLIDSLPNVLLLPARVGANDSLRATVDLLGGELDLDRPGATAAVPALLDLLLTYVIRSAFDSADPTSGWAAALRDRGLTTALHHLQTQPEIAWTVESLAQVAGFSRAVFARRFTETIGQPPLAYLTWWRMMKASQLLQESDIPLSAVAQRVGYSSEYALSKAFRREFEVAPGAHRKMRASRAAQSA